MCNFNVISGLLIGAQLAYIAVLVLLGAAVFNSGSLFLAAANLIVMGAAVLGCGAAAGLFGAALAELNKCRSGPCGVVVAPLASRLIGFIGSMAAMALMLIGITIVAAIPFAGAVAVGTVITWTMSLTAAITAVISVSLSSLIIAFNNCLAAAGAASNATTARVVQVLGLVTGVLIAIEVGLGFEYKFIPTSIPPG